MRRIGSCLLLALLFLAPLASAGSESDPEVTDPAGDSMHADPGRDVVAFWIEDTLAEVDGAPALAFRLVTADDFQHNAALFAAHDHFRVGFQTATVDGHPYVDFRPSNEATGGAPTSETLACRFGVAADASSYADLPAEVALSSTVEGASFTCLLPLDLLGGVAGQTLTDLHVRYLQTFRGPTSGGDAIGPLDSPTLDRAPDDGAGRDYVVPSLDAGPLTLYDEAEGVPFQARGAFANATTLTQVYNWTAAPGDLLLRVDASVAAGNVTVRVVDDGNETVYECLCDANRSDEVPLNVTAAGVWRISMSYDGFAGNLTVSLDAAPEPTGEAPEDPEDPEPEPTGTEQEPEGGNATAQPSEDTPLPVWVALVAVALVAARRRW